MERMTDNCLKLEILKKTDESVWVLQCGSYHNIHMGHQTASLLPTTSGIE